ncbi:uncharacterized protein [Branchiostoma lanceolatum]|uniref:uncharacterized protein isoform X2 n=1 Tax=Branchiostoma lanceolatum TaxID=7740 RepID=UPI0034522205
MAATTHANGSTKGFATQTYNYNYNPTHDHYWSVPSGPRLYVTHRRHVDLLHRHVIVGTYYGTLPVIGRYKKGTAYTWKKSEPGPDNMASMKVFCLVLSVASTGVMVSAASLTPVNVVREGDVFAATWEVPPEYVPPNNLTRAFRITVYDKNSTVSDYCERDAVVKETCYGRHS